MQTFHRQTLEMIDDPSLRESRPRAFFVWTLACSIPFYLCGVLWPLQALPYNLPISAMMVVVPATAAAMLRRNDVAHAATPATRRVGRLPRDSIKAIWIAVALLTMPIATFIAYALMRLFGSPPPDPISIPLERLPFAFVLFATGAFLEEIGWTGYATEPLQRRQGVFGAGLSIGLVWALWHVIPWWLGQGHTLQWVIGQSVVIILARVVMGQLYAYGGRSLALATLFHTMINISWSSLPNGGSHYDPWPLSIVLAAVVGVFALLITKLPVGK